MSMLQYKNVWGRRNDPMPSIRNDFEYANSTLVWFEDSLDPKDVARTENVDIAETADQFEEPIS